MISLMALDSPGSSGYDMCATIGPDGNPIISYYDTTDNDLKVATTARRP